MTYYSNLPPQPKSVDDSAATIRVFDTYSVSPLNIDASTYDAMIGFFVSRGFGEDSANSMSYIVIKQAMLDNYNPFELVETLSGLNEVELSNLITEILNYNRFKTSNLGTASPFQPSEEVIRNIVA